MDNSAVKIGLVGPPEGLKCGISDYVAMLRKAMEKKCELIFQDFSQAEDSTLLGDCRGILIHYESALVPHNRFLKRMGQKYPGKIFVVPHEVYEDNPFAFPYSSLKSRFKILLKLKQLVYKYRHRENFREKKLQRRGYLARKVIPLSDNNSEILSKAGAQNLVEIIPEACFPSLMINTDSSDEKAAERIRDALNPGHKFVAGIFGFLNPATDYSLVLQALKQVSEEVVLLIIGGEKADSQLLTEIKNEYCRLGLEKRVYITGYIPEKNLSEYFSVCDVFLAPFKFKSNSSSLLRLITLNKPVLASTLPLTEELIKLGAPLDLYSSAVDMAEFLNRGFKGKLTPAENKYNYGFNTVAGMYIKQIVKYTA